MNDQASAFFRTAQPDRSRIVYPQDVVFLCGGPLSNGTRTFSSIRDFIDRKADDTLPNNTIVLAERASQKFDSGLFTDLIELETYIASIARVILLVCESAGSIAELGAFSQVPEISEKLQVIVHSDHYLSNSFIRDGPLRFLDNQNTEAVQQFRWRTNSSGNVTRDSAASIAAPIGAAVSRFTRTQHRTESFDASRRGHQILLVAGIIYYCRCCKLMEIVEYAGDFGVPLTRSQVRKYIFCLEVFGWISSVKRGSNYYFFTLPEPPIDFRWFGWRYAFDPFRVRHDIAQAYEPTDPRLSIMSELAEL